MGIYNIDSIEKTDYTIKILAFDNMIKFESAYFSSLGDKPTLQQVVNELSNKTGVKFTGSLPAYRVKKLEGFTCREILGYVASICGGNATITRDGNFTIVTPADNNYTISASNYFDYKREEAKYKIGKISCQVEEKVLSEGSLGADSMELEFENPWVDTAILKDIYNKLDGFEYLGYSMKWQGDPSLDVGDIVTITDKKGIVRTHPILSQKFTYTGGLTSEISAKSENKNKNSYSSNGPSTKKVERIVMELALINKALIDVAYIADLTAGNIKFDTASGTILDLQTLLSKFVTGENGQFLNLTTDNVVIANAVIKDAMIENISVNKLKAGYIDTNKITLSSADGGLSIVGPTMQFKDKDNKIRIQIGRDKSNNFTFSLFDETGTGVLIDHTGIKKGAIANDLIVSDMIAGDSIGEKQINYSSFVSGFNKDTNTNTIKSSKVNIDLLNQTLDIAFNSLKTQADGTKSLTESHSTIIGVMQGEIKTAINNTTITKDGQTVLLKDDYNRTVQTVDSMKSTIGSHTTTIDEHTGKITGVETKVNTVERDLNSITQRVSSTETNVTTIKNTANNALNAANNANNALTLNQQTKMNGIELFNNDYKSNTSAKPFTNGTYSIVPATEISGSNANESNIIKVVNGQRLYTDFIACNINNPYYASIEIYNKDTNNGTNYIQVCYYDKNKTALATNEAAMSIISGVSLPSANEWHKLEGWLNPPSSTDVRRKAKYIRIRIINRYNGLTGITYWRNISWKQLGSGLLAETQETKIEIATTKNKVASIETNLSSITSRVSTIETKQTTTDGKVTSLETWKKEAEVKITDASIISTVSSQFYKKSETDSKYASQSQISQLSNQIALKVDANGVKSIIEQNPNSVKIGFNKIDNRVEFTNDGAFFRNASGGMSLSLKRGYLHTYTSSDSTLNSAFIPRSTSGDFGRGTSIIGANLCHFFSIGRDVNWTTDTQATISPSEFFIVNFRDRGNQLSEKVGVHCFGGQLHAHGGINGAGKPIMNVAGLTSTSVSSGYFRNSNGEDFLAVLGSVSNYKNWDWNSYNLYRPKLVSPASLGYESADPGTIYKMSKVLNVDNILDSINIVASSTYRMGDSSLEMDITDLKKLDNSYLFIKQIEIEDLEGNIQIVENIDMKSMLHLALLEIKKLKEEVRILRAS